MIYGIIYGRKTVSQAAEKLDAVKQLITLLDGYRANTFTDPATVRKLIATSQIMKKREFTNLWKELQPILIKMAKLPCQVPQAVKWKKIEVLTTMFIIFFVFSILTTSVVLRVWKIPYPLILQLLVLIMPPTIAFLRLFVIRKIETEIDRFLEKHPQKFQYAKLKLKNVVQNLIIYLYRQLELTGEDLTEYMFDLYHTDYKGIKILKKNRWKKTTTVTFAN